MKYCLLLLWILSWNASAEKINEFEQELLSLENSTVKNQEIIPDSISDKVSEKLSAAKKINSEEITTPAPQLLPAPFELKNTTTLQKIQKIQKIRRIRSR